MCLATAASSHANVKREFRKKQKARRDLFFLIYKDKNILGIKI